MENNEAAQTITLTIKPNGHLESSAFQLEANAAVIVAHNLMHMALGLQRQALDSLNSPQESAPPADAT